MYNLGLGLMRHNDKDFSTTQKIVDTAIQNGITYIETCNFYLNSKCEEIAEKALRKYSRDSYILCAKLPVKGTLESVRDPSIVFEQQLKTLNTDYFDVYLLQALDIDCFKILLETGAIQYLLKQKQLGRIKRFGFSFHDTVNVLEKYLNLNCFDIVQIQLNYYDWYLSSGKELYEKCREKNIPMIIMGPTKGGVLIDDLPDNAKKKFRDYKKAPLDFLKDLGGIEYVLTGANTIKMLNENIGYANCEKEYTEDQFIDAINIYKGANLIQCTGCNYCGNCPAGLDIKKYFYNYNQILLHGKNYDGYESYMHFLRNNFPADICLNCKRCEYRCPQHLPIRKLLHENIFQLRL